ncbi:MAG: hypothetical protein KAS19_12525 [Anaerolineales bacterium]|nr:hypothetical protein [Anaerolineales bacterium]
MLSFLQKSLLLLLLLVSGSALAGACTYREAIMALEQGNTVRGMALMRMANRDGDERASRYLAMGDRQFEKIETAGYRLQQPLLSLNQVNPEQ